MLLLAAPDTHDFRPLPFYLAMEQWCAANLHGEEVFFTWIVSPTVIIGRNQQLAAEVDVEFCRRHAIDIVRRRSGGGCVYADPDNLMVSYICPTTAPVPKVFASFANRLASLLHGLGLDASVSGRNDILIGDRKVSGCAYYHTGSHAIVHSTLLFGADPLTMMRAITPDRSKLATKGVHSVASRITTISEHSPDITISRFRNECRKITDGELVLTPEQVAEIQTIEATYRAPGWLEGRRSTGTFSKSQRIPGVGLVEVNLSLDSDIITAACITGDFLIGTSPASEIEQALIGRHLSTLRVDDINIPNIIIGLTNQQFINILK